MEKDNSVKKDLLLVVGSLATFYLILWIATWVNAKFGFDQIFNLVDVASLSFKVATASALSWVVKRFVFTQTLGKDFGRTFNIGWANMTDVEKARWTIVTFLVIFAVILQASVGAPIPIK